MQMVYAKPTLLRAIKRKAACQLALGKAGDEQYLLEAATSYATALSLLDLLRLDYQQVVSKQTLLADARNLYEGALETAWLLHNQTGESQYLEDAFAYFERSHSVLLQESLYEAEARQFARIPAAMMEAERELKIACSYAEKRLFDLQQREGSDQEALNHWQDQVFQFHAAHDSLISEFESHYPQYFTLKYQSQSSNIASVQAQLVTGKQQLVDYFTGDSSLFIMGISAGDILFKKIPFTDELSGKLDRFIQHLRDPLIADNQGNDPEFFQQYVEDAYFLYENLLAPIQPFEGTPSTPSTLILVPDGILGYLPFEALLNEAVKNTSEVNYGSLPYLLRSHKIRYAYNASLLNAPPLVHQASKGYAGFAPSYNPDVLASARDALGDSFVGLGNLQGNQPEVSHIQRLIGGREFLGQAATETAFKQNSPNHRILHLAMHAFLHPESPAYSGLVFSNPEEENGQTAQDDGILHIYELYNLELGAELAVLSACNTGSGKLARGEGIMSMARAFRYAGCPNIVMSLWQADDHSTANLMERFYARLKEGLSKDEALRRARLDFLDQNAQKHPYYWAAFVLSGDDRPLFSPAEPSFFFWTVLGLLAITLGVIGWRFFKKGKI